MFDEESELERMLRAARDEAPPLDRFLLGSPEDTIADPPRPSSFASAGAGSTSLDVNRDPSIGTMPSTPPSSAPNSPSTVMGSRLQREATGIHSQIELVRDDGSSTALQTRSREAKDARSYSERLDEIQSAIAELRLQIDARTQAVVDRTRECEQNLDQSIAHSGLAVRDRLDDIYARSSEQEELLDTLRMEALGGGSRDFAQLLATIEQGQQKLRKFVAETTSASDIAFQQFTVAFEDFGKELHEAFTQLDEQVEELALRPAAQIDLAPLIHSLEQSATKLQFLDEAVSRLQVAFIERSFDQKNSLTLGISILIFLGFIQIALLAWLAVVK